MREEPVQSVPVLFFFLLVLETPRHIQGRALIQWSKRRKRKVMAMTEAYAAGRYEEACALLPPALRAAALAVPRRRMARVEELRLRVGRPVGLSPPGGGDPPGADAGGGGGLGRSAGPGHGVLPVHRRRDPEPGVRHRPRRLPGGGVRHVGPGRGGRRAAGAELPVHPGPPGPGGGGPTGAAPAHRGGPAPKRPGPLPAGRGQDHPPAGPGAAHQPGNRGSPAHAGLPGGRAGGAGGIVPGQAPAGCGAPDRRAGRLPQGGGGAPCSCGP